MATITPLAPEKILVPALAKLQKDAAGRYGNAQVKKAAEDTLSQLAQLNGNADGAFVALQVAAASKTPKYMVTALDSMEKLLAHGFLGKTPEMCTKIVKCISACSEQQDDAVQLQVVKALLTAVTSGIAHESNLLLALRACYHIHLVTDNAVNRTTSKVCLTQMITWVFAEVEKQEIIQPSFHNMPIQDVAPLPAEVVQPKTEKISKSSNAVEEMPIGEGMYPSIQAQLGYIETERVDPVVAFAVKEATDQLNTASPPVGAQTGEATATDEPKGVVHAAVEEDDQHHNILFATPSYKDAFLVLRTLSKLAMKEISFEDISSTGAEGKADPRALKSKLLSLELLKAVLEQAGPQLKSADAILFAIKQYLIKALMKNCMEVNIQVASVAMAVFEQLQAKFKDQLKKEIELIISTVLLGLLDSPHASMESRVLVLETLARMCSSIQTMMEIFLNYDCDWNSTDLLRQITETLCKVSLTRMSKDGESEKMPEAELVNCKKLRLMSSAALAGLIKALALYAKIEGSADSGATQATTKAEKVEENNQEAGGSATKLASAALDAFQLKQTWKRDLETAVAKFNEKPKDGIKFLRERGHLDNTPQSVAKFLMENQNLLSKTMIGDYLGDNNDANKDVLYAYTDLFNFKGMPFDEAIRLFLSAFRIPGEAQKIDRVMEKFASRYWAQNPEVFPSADTAFILSYAIIMLQTDAHNPNIKPDKKMKKADFLKQNRGIAGGRDLAPEYLGSIYDNIVAKPITLSGDDVDYSDAKAASSTDFYDVKGKRKAFFKERAEILSDAEQKRKTGGGTMSSSTATKDEKEAEVQSYTFFMVEHSFATNEHVAPMFMVIWKSLSTCFSANLLNTEDPNVATLCLDGLYNAIRVAGRFHLDDERSALIEQLAMLSKLDVPIEIEPKNVMCVQAITALAVTEGNYLGSSWVRVLQCVSELSRLLLLSPTGEDDSINDDRSTVQDPKKRVAPPQPDPLAKTTHALKRVLDYTAIDRIFVRSVNLSEQAILEFVNALTEVSRAELLLKSSGRANGGGVLITQQPITKKSSSVAGAVAPLRPRLFSLQKIVEVADFNIDTRPRYTWGRVWETMSAHFVASGCHPSPQVAMYAVDSLKQLSIKFLDKKEFEGFAFQDRFLRPFEEIVRKADSPDVRALVLHCMQNFIVGKSKSIKSGWGAVFDVIAASSRDRFKDNMNLGFSLLEMSQQYNAPPFLFAQGALKFAHANDATLSNKCIEFVEAYASSAYLPDVQGGEGDESAEGENPAKARELLKGLAGFATMDPRENVRRQALTSVFTILKQALEDRADATIVSKIFMDDVLTPWSVAFNGSMVDKQSLISTLVGGPKWPFSTLSHVVMEVIKFLALALYEIEISTEITPEDFARKRTGGPEDEAGANAGKVAAHPRESAFAPLLDSSLRLFEMLSSKDERSVSSVGVAAYNYCLDMLGNYFSSKAWRMFLESLNQALKLASPAHLNSPDVLKQLGLLGNVSNDSDDETKIQSVSLDELSKNSDGVFLPVAPSTKRTSPSAAMMRRDSASSQPTESTTQETSEQDRPQTAPPTATSVSTPLDLRLAEVRFVTNLGLVKIVCRVLRRPLEKQDLLAKTCDILEHALSDASAFDDNHPLRIELSRQGMVKEGTERPPKEGIIPPIIPPDALEVEVLSAQTLLKFMQSQANRDEARFERVLVGLVNRYLRQDRILAAEQTFKPKTSTFGGNLQPTTKSESEKELLALTPVVLFALRGMLEMDGAPVDRALPWVFPLLLQLIECPNRDVRAIVRRILEKHLTPRLNFRA